MIHTRVSETLDDEIKRRATDLGVSVSNLVRNVLQHTFGLVEDIVHDSAEIARSARGTRTAFTRRPAATPTGRVIGWQQALLNVNAVCDGCNAMLPKGTRAGVGILDGPGAIPIRCARCLEELAHDDAASTSDQ